MLKSRLWLVILMPLFVVSSVLLALAPAVAAPAPDQASAPGAAYLEYIGELTGGIAATTAVSPDCDYDPGYQLYLCPEPKPRAPGPRNFDAAVRAWERLGAGGILLVADNTNDRIMAFDPVDGSLLDADFIPTDPVNLDFPFNAIAGSTGNTILVADFNLDLIQEYDLSGNYLGTFAPAGGVNTAVLEQPRGMMLRPNGNLLVAVGAGGNQDAIAEFDSNGNYVGQFVDAGAGGLDSPYDIFHRNIDWLASSNSPDPQPDGVKRYANNTGAPLGDLITVVGLPQQIARAANDNILFANFSLSQRGIFELLPDGSVVNIYNPIDQSPRGVYELANGNLLVTMGTGANGGVYEIDRTPAVVDTEIFGNLTARYIEHFPPMAPAISLAKTVSPGAGICGPTNTITVTLGADVTYCFRVTNTGNLTFTVHDLVDDQLGQLLDSAVIMLASAETYEFQVATPISETTANTAVWTAGDAATTSVTATAEALVNVVNPAIALTMTMGTLPDECAPTDQVQVVTGTQVIYCYTVLNTGTMTFTSHTLFDSELGNLLLNEPFALAPGESYQFTATAVITETVTNTAVWTAWAPPWSAAADAAATVTVGPARLYLPAVFRP